jgi:hypothetical protein
MKLKLSHMLAVVSVSCLALGAAVLAQDSNIGTWKLNVAKSKFSPDPAPKSQTLKIAPWGSDGVTFTSDGIDAEGKPTHFEFQAKYDGKDMPVKGSPDFDTLAYKRIDANTIEATAKLKGKVVGTSRIVVSADGKTRTLNQTGTNAKGEKVNNTIVYEKQ